MLRGASLEHILLSIPAVLIAITFHEYAHGYVAYKLGDPTAKNYGRLTLNPIRHIDPLGGIMLLVVGFGWAKPVPVNPAYFKNPKNGMAQVALAGPVSNIILAFITLLIAHIFEFQNIYVLTMLVRLVILNIGLAIFNMIPIPPLDGSKIFSSLLPSRIYFGIMRYERYAHIILLLLLFTGILTPFLRWMVDWVLSALTFLVSGLIYILPF